MGGGGESTTWCVVKGGRVRAKRNKKGAAPRGERDAEGRPACFFPLLFSLSPLHARSTGARFEQSPVRAQRTGASLQHDGGARTQKRREEKRVWQRQNRKRKLHLRQEHPLAENVVLARRHDPSRAEMTRKKPEACVTSRICFDSAPSFFFSRPLPTSTLLAFVSFLFCCH